ncbi:MULTISPECIES: O-antigen ligase [unclassified Thioalkalivibrio]|uniref:O-antigen ligase family protein n=1 Tax=unclassified Thioalkalivibrio TaxID=2621013 RepID=UPI0018CAB57F|nr:MULTISPECIES: O-antigen ligase family protein [unclassified Thioalkalivibrio]
MAFIFIFVLVSLPAGLVSNEPSRHLGNLLFGVVGLAAGLSFAYWFCNANTSSRRAFYAVAATAFLSVNAAFVWTQTPGTSEFSGILRDRNYFALYSVFLLWLSHYLRASGVLLLLVRGLLGLLVVLTGSVGGFLMLLAYIAWLVWVKGGEGCRRNVLGCFCVFSLGLVMVAGALVYSPAIERADPIVTFLIDGEAPETGSFARRLHQASEGLRLAKENPFVGLGYGSPQYEAETFAHYSQYSLHNTYLEIWAGAGLLALLVFGGVILLAVVVVMKGSVPLRGATLVGIASVALFFLTYTAYHRLGPMALFGFIIFMAFSGSRRDPAPMGGCGAGMYGTADCQARSKDRMRKEL